MDVLRSRFARTLAVLGIMVASVGFASSANAAPYTKAPSIAVSTTNPAEGSTIDVSGTDFDADSTVTLTLYSQPYALGSVTTDSSGAFAASVTLPDGVTGTHTIVGQGPSSSASVIIEIYAVNQDSGNSGNAAGANGSGSSGSGSGGGLASTGFAVAGIGVVGLGLLVGGTVLLLSGRRRKVSS